MIVINLLELFHAELLAQILQDLVALFERLSYVDISLSLLNAVQAFLKEILGAVNLIQLLFQELLVFESYDGSGFVALFVESAASLLLLLHLALGLLPVRFELVYSRFNLSDVHFILVDAILSGLPVLDWTLLLLLGRLFFLRAKQISHFY